HQKLGARLIEFGGWEMPVQYSSIMDEHLAVRKAAGLFDISHMGELRFSGPGALDFLNHTLTNDLRKLGPGLGQYTLLCNEHGGVIDDLYAYCTKANEFLLVVNASRIEADAAWLEKQLAAWPQRARVSFENASDRFGAVALQGPRAADFIDGVFPGGSAGGTAVTRASELAKNQLGIFSFQRTEVYLARTGYTGEDGFEVIAPAEIIEAISNKILSAGHAHCLQPAGLGARDTLRTEVCYPLYGHELDEQTTPIEAGLSSFVAMDKGEFVGREVLAAQKANGVAKKCVAFKMTEKSAPPRPQYPIWSAGADAAKLGEVSSGTQSPSLGIGIGMGYVPPSLAKAGTALNIEIRGKRAPAVIVPKPIYRKQSAT
ncbi:MAG: glycine cleavage system aminomethyltransferase GcvT, partial [Verrucomicrobia bacterium]